MSAKENELVSKESVPELELHEKHSDVEDLKNASEEDHLQKRDGMVLMPQPSDDPSDPLNWSSFRKHMAMGVISWLALTCYMAVTALVPGTKELARQFDCPNGIAVYLGNMPVVLYGVGPILWSPLSHFLGRRPVLLVCNVIAIVGTAIAASAQTYGACMAGRVILGLGGSAFWTLGPASIGDIFFRHEKGRKIGISTLAIVVGPFAGGIIGGGIIGNKSLGWRWSQWIPLILEGIGLFGNVLYLPETIYVRDATVPYAAPEGVPSTRTLWARYGIRIPKRRHDKKHSFWFVFTRPFAMCKFPVVPLASFWFGVAYMMHVGLTAEIPLIFQAEPFNFDVVDVGLSAFSGLIGALIGELYAGPAIDFIARRALKQGREWRPEMRLQAIWPALVAAPIGLVMFGVSVQFAKSWAPALVGQGIYIFGIEIATTVLQTYLLECYPKQGAEASLIFNLFRNLMSYTAPFFVQPMLRTIKGGASYGMFGGFTAFFFPFTVGVLMWRGKAIRAWSGEPDWSRD